MDESFQDLHQRKHRQLARVVEVAQDLRPAQSLWSAHGPLGWAATVSRAGRRRSRGFPLRWVVRCRESCLPPFGDICLHSKVN